MASESSQKEQNVELALAYTQLGVYSSIRQTALATGIPRSTLGHRRAGRLLRSQIRVRNARLTSKQEDILYRFIEDLQLQYAPINHAQLRVIAANLAAENGTGKPLRKCWITRFI